jgi:hypothetical protein
MLRSSLAILALLPLAGGCRQQLEDFSSADLKFKARFPGTPKRDSKPGPFGVKLATYSAPGADGVCSVGVADLPLADGEADAVTQDRLDGALEAAVRNHQATLKSRASIKLDERFPGREFVAASGNSKAPVIRGRIYLVNRRLYQIVVTGTEKYVAGSEATEFLNSFQWSS